MKIDYPYIPQNQTIQYVGPDNAFMKQAIEIRSKGGCFAQPTSGVLVRNEKIIATGSNASKRLDYCPRHARKLPTGTGYHLCKKYCDQFGHAEPNTLYNAVKKYGGSQEDLAEFANLIDRAYYKQEKFSDQLRQDIHEYFKKLRARSIDFCETQFYHDGHWWMCEPCWTFLLAAGVNEFFLLDKSWEIYNIKRK